MCQYTNLDDPHYPSVNALLLFHTQLCCVAGFPSFSSHLCRHGLSPSTILPPSSSSGSMQQLCRALLGMMLERSMGVNRSWHGGWWLHAGWWSHVSGRENTVVDSSWRWSSAGIGLPQSFLHGQTETKSEMLLLHQQISHDIVIPPQKPPVSKFWQVQWDHPLLLCILKASSGRCNVGRKQSKRCYFCRRSAKSTVFSILSCRHHTWHFRIPC